MRQGISVVLLAYKEAENLRILIPQIIARMDDIGEEYEILVIDTEMALDETEQVCLEYGCRYIHQEEPHFGGAFRTGIKYAQMDKFLILDSDGSHDPKYIPDIYKKFVQEKDDVVIGSRYVKGGHTDDARSSVVMSHILNYVFRLCLGVKAKDISTDYRLYRTELLKGVTLTCENYDVLQEVLMKIKLNKADKNIRIGEVPISFNKRMFGESKRRLIPFIIDYGKSLFRLMAIRFPLIFNFVLYALFGMMAAVLEYSLFSGLIYFKVVRMPELANIIGALTGFLFTFTTNTFLNFKKNDKLVRRFGSYALICLGGMALSTTMISIWKDTVNIYLLKVGLLVVVSLLQFILNKLITYRD